MSLGVRPVDYAALPDAAARQLLTEYRAYIEMLVSRVRPFTVGHDEDDLRSVAELAVLEASLTYEEGRGRSLGTWVYGVIQWRLEELRQDEVDVPSEAGDLAVSPAPGPESRVEAAQLMEWLETNLAHLPPQEGLVLSRKLHGESGTEIGHTVGLTRSRVSQIYDQAVQRLRRKTTPDVRELARAVLDVVD